MAEVELTGPVDLCLPDGRLNPAAVGWTRRPLHRANLRGWGRAKRWEYWGIVSPTHIIAVVTSSLDYAGLHGLYVLDRDTGAEPVNVESVLPPWPGTRFPPRSGSGTVRSRGGGIRIVIDQHPEGTSIRAVGGGVAVAVDVPMPAGHESLGVVVPWSERRFQLTVKDVGRPASGTLVLPDRKVDLDGAFAVLDHGRGKWPYDITWNWAAGSDGTGRAIQLGGKWTDGTGVTENALFLDGRLHKIGAALDWRYDRADWTRPWRITGAGVDATFTPFHERAASTSLGVVANETHQCFGHFAGTARADDGTAIDLTGLTGWAEEAHNRW